MEDKKTIYIIGGIGVVVVVLLLLRKSGGSQPTIITSPSSSAGSSDPNQTRLAELGLNADMFKSLAALGYQQAGATQAANVQLAQIEAGRQVGISQTAAAAQVAAAQQAAAGQLAQLQASTQLSAITAARDVGLAQATADVARSTLQSQSDLTRQQMQIEAQRQQQNSQLQAGLLTGLLSQLGNVLRTIGGSGQQQPAAKPTTGASSGGPSVGASGGTSPTTQRPVRRNPIINFPTMAQLPGLPTGLPDALGNLLGGYSAPTEPTYPDLGDLNAPPDLIYRPSLTPDYVFSNIGDFIFPDLSQSDPHDVFGFVARDVDSGDIYDQGFLPQGFTWADLGLPPEMPGGGSDSIDYSNDYSGWEYYP